MNAAITKQLKKMHREATDAYYAKDFEKWETICGQIKSIKMAAMEAAPVENYTSIDGDIFDRR